MKHGLTISERASAVWERFWLCEVQRIHRVKLRSDGHCIRCNRKVAI